MTNIHDAIVIGAGINGLVAAAYLAKAGLKVIVLERREVIGGSAATEEFYPGFKVNGLAHDAGWLNPKIVGDLGLGQHGLDFVPSDVVSFTPLADDGGLTLWRDAAKTASEIRKFSKSDADKWPAFNARVAKLAGFLEALYTITIPRITTTSIADALTALSLGRKLRRLGKIDMLEVVRWLPMSVAELLNDWFETEALKGTLGARGITGMRQGPRSGGTAFVMLHHSVGMKDERGRMRGLAPSLVSAAQQNGVEIRTGAEITQIVIKNDRAVGVVLANGDEINASRVVSSVDPKRTFLGLIDPVNLEPSFVRAVQNIKYRGAFAKVHLALGELPKFKGADESDLCGVISISPSLDYLEHAYDDAKYGGVSRQPYLHVSIPTLTDPSLAPAGRHVMSIWMQYVPPLASPSQSGRKNGGGLGDLVIDTLAAYAPNLKSAIIHRQVLTPLDLERIYGLTEGHLYHGELTLDQILFMRPVPGWSQYRTPIDHLYLCGAGTHPGGGIAGGAGFNAAREILRDARR